MNFNMSKNQGSNCQKCSISYLFSQKIFSFNKSEWQMLENVHFYLFHHRNFFFPKIRVQMPSGPQNDVPGCGITSFISKFSSLCCFHWHVGFPGQMVLERDPES